MGKVSAREGSWPSSWPFVRRPSRAPSGLRRGEVRALGKPPGGVPAGVRSGRNMVRPRHRLGPPRRRLPRPLDLEPVGPRRSWLLPTWLVASARFLHP